MENEIIGFILVFVGIIIIFLGIILMAVSSGKGEVEGGAIIFIGPIPIVFGSNRKIASGLLILAIILTLLLGFFYFLARRQ